MTDHRQHQPTSAWEEQLRTKLSTHSAQPPADLWGAIERHLAAMEGATREQSRVVPLYARWGAAAAVVALTAGLLWWAGSGPDGEQTNAKPESGLMATTGHQPTSPEPRSSFEASQEASHQCLEASHQHKEATEPEPLQPVTNSSPTIPAREVAKADEKITDEPASPTIPAREVAEAVENMTDNGEVQRLSSAKGRKIELYLAQGNAISDIGGKIYDADPGLGDNYGGYPPYGPTQTSYYYSEHDEPLKTSVLVRLNLTDHLALDAGLSYTYLHSSLIHTGPAASDRWFGDQRVHYLGVPVNLSCYIYEGRRWNAYVSAGAEVAKTVDVDWSKESALGALTQKYPSHLLDHPWQLSVSAALGVQYNLSRRVGIYLQPSVGYFFDNHSSIETYYTEHPFTPSLQVGLRINVNKKTTKLK